MQIAKSIMSKQNTLLVALTAVLPISYLFIAFLYYTIGLRTTGLFNYTIFGNINYWFASIYS
jgi:hypothetical protein